MSRPAVFSLLVVILHCHMALAVSSSPFTLPAGFSLTLSTPTSNGKQFYTCERGVWVKGGSSAELLDSKNSKFGSYESVYNTTTKRSSFKWTITNSAGVAVESGYATSGVTGCVISTMKTSSNTSIAQYLAEVNGHQNSGDASLFSYVALTQTYGGPPPSNSMCTVDESSIGIPFSGVFEFYSQDAVAPPVSQELQPKGMLLQGSFVKGRVVYKYDGKTWNQTGVIGTITDVAGGMVLGKYGTIVKADQYGSNLHWQFQNPSFWLTGKVSAKPHSYGANTYPWQLMTITTTGGTLPAIGAYKNVQLTSTRGGMPPRSLGATAGMTWKSPFTGLFWFYQ